LWLPEFDQYVDPTASQSSFKSLPDREADKTVLRVSNRGALLTRTPPLSAETNRLSIVADVTLSAEGTAKGTSAITASGPISGRLRGRMRQVSMEGGEALAKELLTKQNWHGSGNIEGRPATDHSEPFIVKTRFDLSDNFFKEANNSNIVPMGPR